ncbi:phosphatase PAP2 family protein [Mucilaginibacter sp. E4BP6]|uniref:phosphatase PAP2 family protein n=1 Tax=Mucilaginibacter sp. E4BP6 TaxID=2723089 RepID=UPI0015C9C95A|nr:phosphatase PAP2 family protein [Mucilaginibacter sp. E4BP6]NYE65905.1 undecaprenyl-diphosphatase [Mucilaginibacter sp. E4BP6]
MLEQLLQFDRHLFHIINYGMTNPFFDWIMPWLRTPKFWIPLYVFIVGFCLWKYGKKGIIIIVLIACSAGLADFTSASIFKPLVHRLRPCRDPITSLTDVERVGCGTGFSFPSTHATDHFAMAIFMILIFSLRWKWVWFWGILWAGSISFAQVYVGVHYPVDIFCGALYGFFVGWLFYILFKKIQPKFPDWVPVI